MLRVLRPVALTWLLLAAVAITPAHAQSSGGGSSGGGSSGSGGSATSAGGSSGSGGPSGSGASTAPGAGGIATSPASPSRSPDVSPGSRGLSGDTVTPEGPTAQRPTAVPGVPADQQSPSTTTGGPTAGEAPGDVAIPRADPGAAGPLRLEPNVATGGGRARLGASGKTMNECMASWDRETHVSKDRWRQICGRTLTEPHM